MKARKLNLQYRNIDGFYDLIENLFKEKCLKLDDPFLPSCIFNCNETGINTNPVKTAKVFVNKHDKDAHLEAPTAGKTMFAVLFCVSASGKYLPPFVVYKGLNLYHSWTGDIPQGTQFACTPSGWMHNFAFESWFIKAFVHYVNELVKLVVLFYDGHGSHLTYKMIHTAIN